jgi:hypothetical protein
MEVAAEHAKTVGKCAGIRVEEGLLLDGIALHAGGVSPRHVESSSPIKTNFADTGLAVGNWAAVAAGVAADAVVIEIFDEGRIGFSDALIQNFTQGGHRDLLGLF